MLSIDHGQRAEADPRALHRHRRDVVTRRTLRLRKAKERGTSCSAGIASTTSTIIALIKASRPATGLAEAAGFYALSEIRPRIRDAAQRLTGLEKEKILAELAEVQALITKLSAILSSEKLLLDVIKDELREVKSLFADPRRTEIQGEASDLSDEDLIAEEDMVVTFSHQGYVKRNPVSLYRAPRQPPPPQAGAGTRDEVSSSRSSSPPHVRADLRQEGASSGSRFFCERPGRIRAGARPSSTCSARRRRKIAACCR
jgi:DNA gyrase subunit A